MCPEMHPVYTYTEFGKIQSSYLDGAQKIKIVRESLEACNSEGIRFRYIFIGYFS